MNTRSKLALAVALGAVMGAFSCTWTDADMDDWVNGLMTGSIVGAVFALIAIVIGSLPLCCGIMKPQGKIIATIVIAIGIFIIFIPAIAAKASADEATTKLCARCEADPSHNTKCTEEDKRKAQDAIEAAGIIVGYLLAMGWLCVILGVTAAVIGCCICCKCCKMADEKGGAQAGGAAPQAQVVGQVVGAPVTEENKA